MNNKKIGILTSGGDCGGLNAAIRSIFYRAKNKYNMDVFGIKDGTAGLMQRPVAAIQLTHSTFEGYLLRQGGTFLGSTNKGNPFKFPNSNGGFIDKSIEKNDAALDQNLKEMQAFYGPEQIERMTPSEFYTNYKKFASGQTF